MSDGTPVVVTQSLKIEKRNDAGEIYETVEVEVGPDNIPRARVVLRREGLAPDDAYAWGIPKKEED